MERQKIKQQKAERRKIYRDAEIAGKMEKGIKQTLINKKKWQKHT